MCARVPCLLAAVLIFASVARAEGVDTWIVGNGLGSCGSWIQERRTSSVKAEVLGAWVTGFLTGANSVIKGASKRDILKARDVQGLWSWIDNYCGAHPLDSIAQAAAELTAELSRRVK
jgi:hypothetical protein